jgi:hypothetical protein
VTTVGCAGVLMALVLARQRSLGEIRSGAPRTPAREEATLTAEIRPLLSPAILMAFAYFAMPAASMSAIQSFAVTTMVTVYGAPLGLATKRS